MSKLHFPHPGEILRTENMVQFTNEPSMCPAKSRECLTKHGRLVAVAVSPAQRLATQESELIKDDAALKKMIHSAICQIGIKAGVIKISSSADFRFMGDLAA